MGADDFRTLDPRTRRLVESGARKGGGRSPTPEPSRDGTRRTNYIPGGRRPERDIELVRKRPQPKAPEEPEPEPPVATPYDGPDILSEMFSRWREERDPLSQKAQADALLYAQGLTGFADQYANTVRGSDALASLRDYAGEMRGLYEQGGLTDKTRADLEAARRQANTFVEGQREAVLKDLAERGMAGGGIEAAMGIGDRAAAADRMSMRDLETLSFAQQEALDYLAKSNEANRDLYGIDEGIASLQLDAKMKGLDETYDVTQSMNDAGMKAWNEIYGDFLRNRGDSWIGAQRDVVPASEGGARVLADASSEGRDNVVRAVDGGAAQLTGLGTDLTNQSGVAPPPLTTVTPTAPATSGASGGAAGEQTLGALATIVNNAVANGTSDDPDDDGGG